MISKDELSRMYKRVLPTSIQQDVWRPVRRICMWIIGLKGLKMETTSTRVTYILRIPTSVLVSDIQKNNSCNYLWQIICFWFDFYFISHMDFLTWIRVLLWKFDLLLAKTFYVFRLKVWILNNCSKYHVHVCLPQTVFVWMRLNFASIFFVKHSSI